MALLTNINGKFSVDTDGAASFNRVGGSTTTGFTFPSADGANGYVLKTNGSGTVSWSPDSSPTVYWAANGNDIYNTNSANVGIGTASPDAKLHVEGGIGIFNVSDDWQQSTLGTYLFRGANFATTISNETSTLKIFPAFSGTRTVGDYWGGINFMHLDPDNSTWGTTYTGANFWVGGRVTSLAGQELSALVFAVNSLTTTGSQPTEKMVILPNGKVGIGTTEPKGVLSVDSGVAKTSTTFTRIASFKTSEAYASFPLELSIAQRGHATSGSQSMELQAGHYGLDFNANLVLQRDGGNVGIGNDTPTYQLDVLGAGAVGGIIHIKNTDADQYPRLAIQSNAKGYHIGVGGSGAAGGYANDLYFYDNNEGAVRMRIASSGQIQFPRTGQPPITNSLYGNIVLDSNAVTNFQRIRYDVGTTPYWGLTRLNTGNFAITGGSTWNDHAIEIDYTTQNVFIDQKLAVGQTTAPGRMLEVNGGTTSDGAIKLSCSANLSNYWSGIEFSSSVATSFIYMASDDVDGTLKFFPDASLKASLSKAGTWTVAADVIAYGSPSDIRLKENIKPIESALDKVSKLQGVTFDWKESDSILDIKEDIGFIAQDVQKVIPELVRENKDGMLSMRHQGIAPILLEAIKELKAEIEELKLNKCNCNCNK